MLYIALYVQSAVSASTAIVIFSMSTNQILGYQVSTQNKGYETKE